MSTFEKVGFYADAYKYWLIHHANYRRILYHATRKDGVTVLLEGPLGG